MYMQTMPKSKSKPAAVILETHNLQNTVWGKQTIDAEKRGHFTDDQANEAGSWVTCACGKNDLVRFHVTPNGTRLEPVDPILKVNGLAFADYVRDNRFVDAAETLVAIEQRASLCESILSTATQAR